MHSPRSTYTWRKKKGAQGPVLLNPIEGTMCKVGYPSIECQRREDVLAGIAQKGVKVAGAKILAAGILMVEYLLGRRRKLITIS